MNTLLVTYQTVDVSNAICYRAALLAPALKTGKWRFPRLYGELPASVTAPVHSRLPRHYIPVRLFIEKTLDDLPTCSVNKIASMQMAGCAARDAVPSENGWCSC